MRSLPADYQDDEPIRAIARIRDDVEQFRHANGDHRERVRQDVFRALKPREAAAAERRERNRQIGSLKAQRTCAYRRGDDWYARELDGYVKRLEEERTCVEVAAVRVPAANS